MALDALKFGRHGVSSKSLPADVSLSIKVLIDRLEYQKNTEQELISKQKDFSTWCSSSSAAYSRA